MSRALDANILVYAAVQHSPFHARASAFLHECVRGPDLFYLAWPTLMAFVRLATNPAIVKPPLSPAAALQNVESLIALPHVRLLSEQDGFWEVFRSATEGLTLRGNLVTDAHLAALLRQHGVRVFYSNDTDFRRFPFLDVRNPLS